MPPPAPSAPFWRTPLPELLAELGAEDVGLSSSEAARRRARFGPNLPGSGRGGGTLRQVLRFFGNPLVLILLVSALLAAAFGEVVNASLIATMIIVSLVLNFWQTYRSLRAAELLRHSVVQRVKLLRDGHEQVLPSAEVVPGDVFRLAAGDLVPADSRLLEAKDLFTDQAALTGESFPAEKQAQAAGLPVGSLDAATNAVFAGSSVISGTGRALAVHTGRSTLIGGIASALEAEPPPTEFERGMTNFSYLILRVIVALVLFVFFVLALLKANPIEALLFSLALAVGLTPEFLPMIITVTLSRGAQRMAKQRVIVKQLQAIDNFGSIDVLCTDKTGTLTEGAIVLERWVDAGGRSDPAVLEAAVLNSENETGIRSPLDEAILATPHPPSPPCRKLDEVPFDFHRRRLSVVLEVAAHRRLITKGAPESVLEVCGSYRAGDSDRPLDASARAHLLASFRRLSSEGLRVLALAEREVPPQAGYEAADEVEMCFLGYLGFLDPPRADAAATLAALERDGVRVVLLTGDNEWVTRQVCSAIGLGGSTVLRGEDLDRIRPEALPRVVERVSLFARLTPEQKRRVIAALQAGGHVVGYLGDGINDAPSLRAADVGISVDSAVDIAREAAPIILLDKDLAILHLGVLEGRRSYANVLKYIMMGTSSNFGNMVSMAAAAIFLPFLPMLPGQILLNNLLYDSAQLPLPGDRVEAEDLLRPRRWNMRFIQRFMLFMGPLSSLFDMLTFALLLWGFHATPTLFRSGWFVESLLTQTLVIFVIRTRANPLRSRPSAWLTTGVLASGTCALVLPYTGLGAGIGFEPLPAPLLAAIAVMTLSYLVAAEAAKRLFYRGFGPSDTHAPGPGPEKRPKKRPSRKAGAKGTRPT